MDLDLTHYRTVAWRWAASRFWLFLPAARLLAGDPGVPPGNNFDLSHWSITLPDQNASVISPAQLTAGFTNDYFYTGADGAMVFWCPVTGGTTFGSDFPRSELREMLNPAENQVNWTTVGTHMLNAECRVTQLPSAGRVVIGQIHSYLGSSPPLVLLVFNNGQIEGLVKLVSTQGKNTSFPLGYVDLGKVIRYQIRMSDGVISMTVNGVNQTVNVLETDPAWAGQTFYFKAGSYCLDNNGLSSEGAKVRFFQLSVEHVLPSVITHLTANTNQCCVTWTTQPGREYFLQGSPSMDRNDWSTLSPVLTARDNTTSYCIPLPSQFRYFRVGMIAP